MLGSPDIVSSSSRSKLAAGPTLPVPVVTSQTFTHAGEVLFDGSVSDAADSLVPAIRVRPSQPTKRGVYPSGLELE
jgi:hypothetical protein